MFDEKLSPEDVKTNEAPAAATAAEPAFVPYEEDACRAYQQNELADWLKTAVEGAHFNSWDKTGLQFYHARPESPRGTVVFLHGYCEFFGKYHELCYDFYQRGYEIWFLEQRGHGLSDRKAADPERVHVEDFREYTEDFKFFLDEYVVPQSAAPLMLFAHSMGGAVGARFLETYPDYFRRAILSSPMIRIKFGALSPWMVKLVVIWSRLAHWTEQRLPGGTPFTGEPAFNEDVRQSRARYDYQFAQRLAEPSYQTNSGTYSWGRAAIKNTKYLLRHASAVKIPVLLLQASKDSVVDTEAQDLFCAKAAQAKKVVFPESEHEIFNSDAGILPDFYAAVWSFLEEEPAAEA